MSELSELQRVCVCGHTELQHAPNQGVAFATWINAPTCCMASNYEGFDFIDDCRCMEFSPA